VLLALDGLLFALVIFSRGSRPILKYGVALPLTLILCLGGLARLTQVNLPARQANPIPPSSLSIQQGARLFASHCAACHGEMGMGDGALAKSLNPKPADLMVQGAAGVHSDEELYGWIGNGFPGSAMPGFKSTLTETERWNLVNFIRTLAGG
jgi:mono/diheme cytochrome c family protein